MILPHPSTFQPALTEERLTMVATWLLEELDATEDDLTRPTDSRWGRACATFDRQKNRIFAEWRSKVHPWFDLKSGASFAVVMSIDDIPCRFSNDDPANPSKDAVLSANHHQQEFLEFVEDQEPGQFCFIVDRGHDDVDPRVEFFGYTPTGAAACRWVSSERVRVLREIEPATLAQAVEVKKRAIALKAAPYDQDGTSQNAAESGR